MTCPFCSHHIESRQLRQPVVAGAIGHVLTGRERQVARLVAQAWTNKDIANCLGISEQTVKNHLHNAFDKIGVDNRVGLTAYVLANDAAPAQEAA